MEKIKSIDYLLVGIVCLLSIIFITPATHPLLSRIIGIPFALFWIWLGYEKLKIEGKENKEKE